MDRIAGIGEYIISNNQEDILKTYALASCVGVTAYSSTKRVAGMIHIALPTPKVGPNPAIRPGYYAATGIPLFFNKLCLEYGCNLNELRINLYGGSSSINEDVFQIGKKNVNIIKKLLLDMKLYYDIDDTGGYISRTLFMNVVTGEVKTITHPIII
jgi:chemotaxis protein CheD